MPMEKSFFKYLYRPIDPFLSAFSIYQSWAMFAENPSRINSHISAEIFFTDGTQTTFNFPKSEELSIMKRYSYGERYRKIISEVITVDANYFLWSDVALFALRRVKEKYPLKFPRLVQLQRSWYLIPHPGKTFIVHSERTRNFRQFKFFTYEVP
jgi:hypothetical protein